MKPKRPSQLSESSASSSDSESANEDVKNVANKTLANGDSSDSESGSSASSRLELSQPDRSHQRSPLKSKKTVISCPLQRYAAENPDQSILNLDDELSSDDEVAMLQIPSNFDVENLTGKVLNFDRKSKFKHENTKYVVRPTSDEAECIFVLTKKLQKIHTVSILKLETYTKEKKNQNNDCSVSFSTTREALPKNLKTRHPLFGSEYENKIVLDEETEMKLNNTIEEVFQKPKKKKKKKKVQPEEEPDQEAIFQFLESHKKPKSIKQETPQRRPSFINSTIIPDLQLPMFDFDVSKIGSQDSTTSKKKKEKSKNIENNIINIKQELSDIVEDLNHEAPKKKKKKKDKSEIEESILDDTNIPKKKKKNKNKSGNEEIAFESTIDDFNPTKKKKKSEVNNFSEVETKKKRKNMKVEKEEMSFIANLPQFGNLETSPEKKGTKRIKSEQFSDTSESYESPKKKLKKSFLPEMKSFSSTPLPSFNLSLASNSKKESIIESDSGVGTISNEEIPEKKQKKRTSKKKALTDDRDHLISDILNSVKSQLESSTHKKKRKHSNVDK